MRREEIAPRAAASRPVSGVFLYRLLRRGRGISDYDGTGLFGVEEMHALNSLKVLAACLSNLCAVLTFIVSGAVVWQLLRRLDAVCRRRRIYRSAVCAKDECGRAQRNRRGDGLHDGRVLFLEEWRLGLSERLFELCEPPSHEAAIVFAVR